MDMHPRQFRVRYTYNHPLENNDWGDFQMHRSKYYKRSYFLIGKLENSENSVTLNMPDLSQS